MTCVSLISEWDQRFTWFTPSFLRIFTQRCGSRGHLLPTPTAALRLKALCLEPPRLSQRSLGRDHAVSEHLSTSHKDGGVNVLFPTRWSMEGLWGTGTWKYVFTSTGLNGTRAYQTHGLFCKRTWNCKARYPKIRWLKTSLSSFIQSPKLIDELLSDATRSLLMRLSAAPVRSRRRNLRGSPIGALDLEQLGQNCERILQLPSSRPREPFLMDQMEQNQLLMLCTFRHLHNYICTIMGGWTSITTKTTSYFGLNRRVHIGRTLGVTGTLK